MYPGTWRVAANLPATTGTPVQDRQVSLPRCACRVPTLDDSSPCRGDWSVRPRPRAKVKVPKSHFRTAPHALDPIRPFTSHRPSDRLQCFTSVPRYHHLDSKPRLPCVPPLRPSQQPLHGLRQPTTVAFVITSCRPFSDAQAPELLRPNAQPASRSNIAAVPSSLLPVNGLTARVHAL